MADVGDEVAAYLLDPPLPGPVLDQGQHQAAAQRGDPGGDVAGGLARPPDDQLHLADLAVAAYLRDHGAQLRVDHLGPADQAERVRRRGRLDDQVGVVDDDRAAAQDRQDSGDLRRNGRWLDVERDVLLAVADVPGEHRAAGDDGADDRGEERLERRIHILMVLPDETGLDALRVGFETFTRRSRVHPDWSFCALRLLRHA